MNGASSRGGIRRKTRKPQCAFSVLPPRAAALALALVLGRPWKRDGVAGFFATIQNKGGGEEGKKFYGKKFYEKFRRCGWAKGANVETRANTASRRKWSRKKPPIEETAKEIARGKYQVRGRCEEGSNKIGIYWWGASGLST